MANEPAEKKPKLGENRSGTMKNEATRTESVPQGDRVYLWWKARVFEDKTKTQRERENALCLVRCVCEICERSERDKKRGLVQPKKNKKGQN